MQNGYTPTLYIPGPNVSDILFEGANKTAHSLPVFLQWINNALDFLVVLSIPISLFFLIGIIYCVEQLKVIRRKEALKHDVKIEPAFVKVKAQGSRDLTIRWQKVASLLNSQNPNDWKQAILEADQMLLDVLTGLGYQGDGVGEKLKRVQPGEFRNIDDAWEAHKTRNSIAHGGAPELDHRLAVQTIHKYRGVFEEFYYI